MKVRLNKKTKEALSTTPVLGTLQTKQKQVNEDITTYIDEPFLKPENIRHGVTIAGVDGKYLDEVKYVNIYDVEGNHLRTLASAEPTPEIKIDNDNIILTNKPFENQRTYGTYEAYIKESSDSIVKLSNTPIKLNESSTNLVAVEKSNYSTQGVYTSISDYNTTPYVNFYESVITGPEPWDGFSITDQAILDNSGRNALKYTFQGSSYHPNCFIEYMNLQNAYDNQGTNGLDEAGISVTQNIVYANESPFGYYQTTIAFPEAFDLTDPTLSFGIRAHSTSTNVNTDTWNVCYKSGVDNNVIIGDDAITVKTADGSFFEKGCKIDKNTLTFVLKKRFTHFSDGQEYSYCPTSFDIHIARVCNDLPEVVVENAFKNIPESTDINIPYYVELPTKAYELGFDEDVAIGETSRMLVQRNSNYMEYNHYLSKLESAAPGLHKVSDTSFDTSRVTVYETLSQRITVQYLEYDYSTIANSKVANHCELRIIEDSRTGEFRRTAFSNTGCGAEDEYDMAYTFDNSAFIMLYDNEGYPNRTTDGTKRYPGGMGFVFRLADGSFFVIDGGMGGNNEYYSQWKSQAETLLNALRAYAPNPNQIRIAGWLLTHLHQDHVGVFDEVVSNHLNTVSIEKVIYSLPAEGFSGFDKPAAYSIWDDFEEALNTLRAAGKTEIIKAHMGMKFNFCNLGLTILSAPENVYRSGSPTTGEIISDITNINDSCVVCKVSYCSKELLFLADASNVQLKANIIPLLTNYIGNGISVIQVPHHGYSDTNANILYDQLASLGTISPIEFTLWPVCYEHFWGKNLDGSVYQEEPGVNYTGVYEHSHNAAIKNITAIYPENNYSMVATPSTIGEWTFTAVDFVGSQACDHSYGGGVEPYDDTYHQYTCGNCGEKYLGEHRWNVDNTYCVECGQAPAVDPDKTPFTCAHCGGTHYFEDGYEYCYSCDQSGAVIGSGCTASCPNGGESPSTCTHSDDYYTYSQDGDASHSIYCTACQKTIRNYVPCDIEYGYCVFCGNNGCYQCGFFSPAWDCTNCGHSYCYNCTGYNNTGTNTCPNCS